VVRVDPRYFRPTEVDSLIGDARNARRKTGLAAPRVSFKSLVAEMVREDLKAAKRDELSSATATRHTIITNSQRP